MMMKTMFILTSMILSILSIKKNPVKVSFNIMILTLISSTIMMLSTNTSWYSLIFMLIMIGGILILFSMMASIYPNEKMKKKKKMMKTLMYFSMTLAMMLNFMNNENQMNCNQMKWFSYSNKNLMMMLIMMTIFFQCTMKMLSKKKNSMRSLILCYKHLTL